MTIFNLPRHERTPETEVDVLLTNLSVLYNELHPDEDKYCFINTWFREFYENENTSGDIIAETVNRENAANDEGGFKVFPLQALAVSLAYCCQAQRAFENGNINEAWSYVVDARFWCDIPLSKSKRVDRFIQVEHKAAVSAARRAAGSASQEIRYGEYRRFVIDEYQSGGWKSEVKKKRKNMGARAAAAIIAPKLEQIVKDSGSPWLSTAGDNVFRWTYDVILEFEKSKK